VGEGFESPGDGGRVDFYGVGPTGIEAQRGGNEDDHGLWFLASSLLDEVNFGLDLEL